VSKHQWALDGYQADPSFIGPSTAPPCMSITNATNLDRKSGGSREPALSEVEWGPAVRLSWTQLPHDNRLRLWLQVVCARLWNTICPAFLLPFSAFLAFLEEINPGRT
jgi:hypothetical protein